MEIQLSAYQYDIKYRKSEAECECRRVIQTSVYFLDEESEDVNRVQVARVPINAKQLREDKARDPVLSRVIHFTLCG